MFGGLVAGLAVWILYKRNTVIPITKGLFVEQSKKLFHQHPTIKKLGDRNKFVWGNVQGGRTKADAEIKVDVSGPIKGTLNVNAKYT